MATVFQGISLKDWIEQIPCPQERKIVFSYYHEYKTKGYLDKDDTKAARQYFFSECICNSRYEYDKRDNLPTLYKWSECAERTLPDQEKFFAKEEAKFKPKSKPKRAFRKIDGGSQLLQLIPEGEVLVTITKDGILIDLIPNGGHSVSKTITIGELLDESLATV